MIWGIIKIIEVGLFLYLVWRRLRDDYKDGELINYSWWALVGILVGGRIGYGLVNWGVWNESWGEWLMIGQKPGFNIGGGLVGWGIVTVMSCKKYEWKLWPMLESVTDIIYLWLIWTMGIIGLKTGIKIEWASYLLVLILGVGLSWWVVGKYRSFVWYKSGKKGFVFFFVNTIVALLLAGVAGWWENWGIMTYVYLIMSLISLAGLVILGNEKN